MTNLIPTPAQDRWIRSMARWMVRRGRRNQRWQDDAHVKYGSVPVNIFAHAESLAIAILHGEEPESVLDDAPEAAE